MSEKEEKEEAKGFKVQDRRRFSAEGELKPEFSQAAEEAPAPSKAAPQDAPAAEAPPRPAADTSREDADAAAPEMTFASFLVGLSAQVLIHLGEVPDPASGEVYRDFVGAQQLIDLIAILQEKTRGNLDASEASMIEAILFDLRMKYVELAGSRPA
jgi:biotin carboxyl carrier protein